MAPRHLQVYLLSCFLGKRKTQDHFHFIPSPAASRDCNAYPAFRHHNLHFSFGNFNLVTRFGKYA